MATDPKIIGYARRWFVDGEKPAKVLNEKRRWEWPLKFKFMEVTRGRCLKDDVPLVALSELEAVKAQRDRLLGALNVSKRMLDGTHKRDDGKECPCSQCDFVRARDAAIAESEKAPNAPGANNETV